MIYVKNENLYEHQRKIQHFMINENVLTSALNIDKIIREEPERAWQIILTGIKSIPSPILFKDFVENYLYIFLSLHGNKYLKQIEKEATKNTNLCRALEIVLNYKSSFRKISKKLLTQIEKVISPKADSSIEKNDINQNIINSWLVYKTTSWVSGDLDELVKNEPILALEIIIELITHANSIQTLAYIAAGLLEDLLNKHSYKIIEKIETKAAESQRFRLCLSGVWKTKIPDDIWERLKIAIKNDWLDYCEGALPHD